MRSWKIAVVVTGLLVEQGCWLRKEPRKASIVIPPVPQPAPPQPIAAPPQLPPAAQTPNLKTAQQIPQLPAPNVPVKAKPKPKTKTPAVVATTPPVAPGADAPETQPSALPAVPAPQAPALQPILGTQEANERNKRIQQYLSKARVSILKAERSNPDGTQKGLIEQVRTFVAQAEELRKVDLVRAENLAERAEVLSRGLKQ